jgi:predicted ferric reductase
MPLLKQFLNIRVYDTTNIKHYLWLLLFLMITGVFMWWGAPCLMYLTRVTGCFMSPILLFIIILPLKTSFISSMLNIPYQKLFLFHIWLSYLFVILSILHTSFYIANYSTPDFQNLPYTTIQDMFIPITRMWGTLAFMWGILFIISTCFRRQSYTKFKYFHFSFVLMFVFIMLHKSQSIPFLVLGLTFITYDFIETVAYGFIPNYKATLEVCHTKFVKITVPYHNLKYKPGEHIYINIPKLSRIEWHPFTIASAPHDDELYIYVCGLGSFTKKLVTYALDNEGIEVDIKIKGPYGSHPFNYKDYSEVVLFAGAIGITAFLSLVKELFIHKITSNVKQLTVVWYCKDLDTLELCAEFFDTIADPRFRIYPYVKSYDTLPVSDVVVDIVNKHRPNRDIVESRRILVISCGSKRLTYDVWEQCNKYTSKALEFDFYNELFEF